MPLFEEIWYICTYVYTVHIVFVKYVRMIIRCFFFLEWRGSKLEDSYKVMCLSFCGSCHGELSRASSIV